MKNSDFRKWLEQFPDDTIIECVCRYDTGSWNGCDSVETFEFDPEDTDMWYYVDFINNPHVTPQHKYYNKKYLLIGEN